MTNGDAIRAMTNEEIARLFADDRVILFKHYKEKFGINFDLDVLGHTMYCVQLEWLNREVKDAETET